MLAVSNKKQKLKGSLKEVMHRIDASLPKSEESAVGDYTEVELPPLHPGKKKLQTHNETENEENANLLLR